MEAAIFDAHHVFPIFWSSLDLACKDVVIIRWTGQTIVLLRIHTLFYQEFAIPEETGGDESPKVQRIKVITRDTDTD